MRRLIGAALAVALATSVSAAAGASEHTSDPVPPSDAVAITVDAPPREARLDRFEEVHWYRFDAVAGRDYWITLDTGGNRSLPPVDAWLSLHDATGALVDTASASDDDELRWKYLAGAQETTYFIRVFTNWRSHVLTGNYGLTVHTIDDDHGDTPAEGTVIDLAATTGSAGIIDYEDDMDWFRFSAEAGDLYHITAPDTVEMSIRLLFATGDDPDDDSAAAGGKVPRQWGTERGPVDLEGKPWLFEVSGRYAMSIETASGEQGGYPRPYAVDFELLTDDHSNTPWGAGPLPVGEETLASHDYRRDEDWFLVDLVDGHSYVAELSRTDHTLSGLSIDLFGSAREVGRSISWQDRYTSAGAGSKVVWRASETGPHLARVTDSSSDPGGRFPGEYAVVVRRRSPDDHADDWTDATSLPVGVWTEGTLEASGDRDWYRFTARGGALYALEYQLRPGDAAEFAPPTDPAAGFDVFVYFVDEDGAALAIEGYSDESGGARHLVFLSETYGGEGGIDYRFRLVEHEQEPVDHADDRAGAGLLRAGETVAGAVSEDDPDWFAFDAQAGDIYSISTVSRVPGAIAIEVLDDDVQVPSINRRFGHVGDNWSEAGYEFWMAPESGRYWVRVLGRSRGPEVYGLTVTRPALAEDDHGDSSADATRLDPSPTLSLLGALGLPPQHAAAAAGGRLRVATARGRFESFADVDWFEVDLTRGVKYRIAPAARDSDPSAPPTINAKFALWDGDAVVGRGTIIEYVPTVTGPHFLAPEGSLPHALVGIPGGLPLDGLWGPFEYGIDVEVVAPDDFPDLREAAPVVSPEDSLHGTLETSGDLDWFRVDALEGQTWIIQFDRSNWGCLQVHGPEGAGVVLERCSDDRILWTAFERGEYGIRLSSSGDASGSGWMARDSHPVPSDYSLALRVADPDDHGQSLRYASLLQSGEERSGRIDYVGDRDVFRIDVERGDTWRIEITGSDTGISHKRRFIAREEVTGTANLARGFDGPFGEGSFDVAAPVDGTWLVVIGGGQSRGAYSITAEQLGIADDFGNSRAYAQPLRSPVFSGTACADESAADTCEDVTTVTGQLDYAADTDYFRVPLEAGKKYEIRVESSSPGVQFSLLGERWCAYGGPMTGWAWRHRVWSPAWTGDYWIRVDRFIGRVATPESYTLSIAARADDHPTTEEAIRATATQLEPDQVYEATIGSGGRADLYRVSVDHGRYLIEVNGRSLEVWGRTEADAFSRTWVDERSRWLLEIPSSAPSEYLFTVSGPASRDYTVVVREFTRADEDLVWTRQHVSPAGPPDWCEPEG